MHGCGSLEVRLQQRDTRQDLLGLQRLQACRLLSRGQWAGHTSATNTKGIIHNNKHNNKRESAPYPRPHNVQCQRATGSDPQNVCVVTMFVGVWMEFTAAILRVVWVNVIFSVVLVSW